MSIKQFTTNGNIQMLWDVVSDENIFRFLSPDIQNKVYNLFINNIAGFFDSEKGKSNSLVELNKKYIMLILNHIKNTYPYQPSKIKIHNEQLNKELITYEEIQNDRKSQFERDFTKKQEEFEDYMTIKAPPVPEFSDKQTDSPIKEMDKILKEMQAKRNYEVEQINKIYHNSNANANNVDNWLKPQETSLKSEKFNNTEKYEETQNNLSNNRFKYLNQLESPTNSKKNVSFSENNEIKTFSHHDYEDNDDDNILGKLKKVNSNNNIKLQIHEETIKENNDYNDRILALERNMIEINNKINKIINMLNK